eukprot:scaffold81105_cov55-Phaeocystis_antarctica.AAC.1
MSCHPPSAIRTPRLASRPARGSASCRSRPRSTAVPGTPLPRSRRAVRVGLACSPGAPAGRAAAVAVVRAVWTERQLTVTRAAPAVVVRVVARAVAMEAARGAVTVVAAPEEAREAAKAVASEVAWAAARAP